MKKVTKVGVQKKTKIKPQKVDGLGPDDLKKIQRGVRQAWMWSHAWRLVKKRCTGVDGFSYCEGKNCASKGKPVPKIFVDHIDPVGEITGPDYIKRTFVPSVQLQGLCKKCHDPKTKKEAGARAAKKRAKKSVSNDDFF